MNKISKLIVACSYVLFVTSTFAANETTYSPVGFWKTIDDVSGQPKGIVQIWETPDKSLYSKIIKIYPRPGYDQNELCTACKGEKHNQRIVGMVFLEHVKPTMDNDRAWTGGEILDPKNGKKYHCNIQMSENGEKLTVRGYIGLPLFGRSQTWLRVNDLSKT